MNKKFIILILSFSFILFSCDRENMDDIDEPSTYSFLRNGESTVSFSGQTARIQMAEELIDGLLDFDNATETNLLEMYRNETASGEDANPFASADLNASDKSIKSKVAASADFFSSNSVDAASIKADFEAWITGQISEVFPAENTLAEAGVPGQLADGSATRYVNAQGLEYNQMVILGLLGALMTDQALNHYLSPAVLDEGSNRDDNENEVLVEGQNYTNMEHKWDEAYGYLYGTAADVADPNATVGSDDSFLNKYIGRVDGDSDFAGLADDIYNAFKLGRAAIVAGNYEVRDEQAEIIRENVSLVIAVRSIYYLQNGKIGLANNDLGGAFHDFSEGLGFIYSLQFTRQPNSGEPYFTKAEVDEFLDRLLGDGPNGFWDVKNTTLDDISQTIADAFGITVDQAAS